MGTTVGSTQAKRRHQSKDDQHTLRDSVCTMRGRDDLEAEDLTALVERALGRDQRAWAVLVRRVERVVWKAVNLVTPIAEVQKDAFASTMCRLAEHLSEIREPEKLPGWLAVTATREAIALSRRESHHIAVPLAAGEPAYTGPDHSPEVTVEQRATVSLVRRALAQMDDTCRLLLTVLFQEDPMPYADVAALFGRPVGWIGPTRGRCLEKFRSLPEVAEHLEARPA
jgi:RNA polymerase sigma factor (sigma-70 family)